MMMRRSSPERVAPGLARRFAADGTYQWGRQYLALLLIEPLDRDDQGRLASLLRRAWDAGGYHLQLEALETAAFFAGSYEPHRSEIVSVLRSLETSNVLLQSSIVEALSGFGELEPGLSYEDLRKEISEILRLDDRPEARRAAAAIVSNQFEPQNIVGPYYDVVAGLSSADRLRLLVLAASDDAFKAFIHLEWTLHELTTLVPTGDSTLDDLARRTLASFLDGPPTDSSAPQDATNAWLAAIRGWAKIDRALPQRSDELIGEEHTWSLIAELLFRMNRDDCVFDTTEMWGQLHQDVGYTFRSLAMIESAAYGSVFSESTSAIQQLYAAYPRQLQELFERALADPEPLITQQIGHLGGPVSFIMRALGEVGDASSAERLRAHTLDPRDGQAAVSAIRRIYARHQI